MTRIGDVNRDNPGVITRPPFIYLGAFLLVLACHWIVPLRIVDGAPWAGLALLVIGVATAIWGRRTMRAAGTNINPSQPATTIVTSGPFRFSRNPLYVSLMLVYLGLSLAVNTWWGVVMLVPLLIVMHVGVVLREERYLDRKFGESYRQYRVRVRRYL
jgi:protein-S-isoprenylcysteine O-methyltransferase Ste14